MSDIEKDSISRDSSDVIPASKWIEHYSKLFNNPCNIGSLDENKMKEFSDMRQEPFFNELDNVISLNEVISSVNNLKNNKAVGLDNVSSEML